MLILCNINIQKILHKLDCRTVSYKPLKSTVRQLLVVIQSFLHVSIVSPSSTAMLCPLIPLSEYSMKVFCRSAVLHADNN